MTDTDAMRERTEEKEQAILDIETAIAHVVGEGREPDDWETTDLVGAIASLSRGLYRVASIQASRALTPKAKRTPLPTLPKDKHLERCDIRFLTRALDSVRQESVMPYPIFGEIRFA